MSRQPDRDWRSELARHDVRASHENLSTQVSIFRFILRVIFLPGLVALLPPRSGESNAG